MKKLNKLVTEKIMGWKRKTFNNFLAEPKVCWADKDGNYKRSLDNWDPLNDGDDMQVLMDKFIADRGIFSTGLYISLALLSAWKVFLEPYVREAIKQIQANAKENQSKYDCVVLKHMLTILEIEKLIERTHEDSEDMDAEGL